ncbi:MAG: hypothetical protein H0T93_07330 [Chloroflexia bacterium]|nr:hypothetical protein [Chloroflexia bacterium]
MSAMRKPSGVPVKVSLANHTKLQEWANADERPTGDIVNELIERHERERFWNQAYDQLARLKADPVAWQDYMEEIAGFDALAGDGLEDEDPYYTPEEEREILANAGRAANG